MGMSASQGLKIAADAAFARGDVAEGKRLMKMYVNARVRAEKEKFARLVEAKKREEREMERRRKKEEAERKKRIK